MKIQPIYNSPFLTMPKKSISFGYNGMPADSFETSFDKRKHDIIEKLSQQDHVRKNGLLDIQDSDCEEELEDTLCGYVENSTFELEHKMLKHVLPDFQKIVDKQKSTLDFEKYYYNLQKDCYDILTNIYKSTLKDDTDPEIAIIKDILKTKYGVKKAYFNNDTEFAKMCLDSAKIMKENGLKSPEQIIACPYIQGGGLSSITSEGMTAIINPDYKNGFSNTSTENPLHIIVHEFVHCNQPQLIVFNAKDIPARFDDTITNLSDYASGNYTHEIHAELKTKQLLSELKEDEEELLNYIETLH